MFDETHKLYEEEEMANVSPDITGIPYALWVDCLGNERNTNHNEPRIKVEVEKHKYIPIIISDNPDIPESVKKKGVTDFRGLQLVKKYVKNYKDIFLAHYNRKINDSQLLACLGALNEYKQAEEKLKNFISPKNNVIINYHWDEKEMLFEVEAVSDSTILATAFAMNEGDLFSIIENYKKRFNTEVVNKISS